MLTLSTEEIPAIPYFGVFNEIIDYSSNEVNIHILFQHFQRNKCTAVPHFNIFNKINAQSYLVLEFSIE